MTVKKTKKKHEKNGKIKQRIGKWLNGASTQNLLAPSIVAIQHKTRQRRKSNHHLNVCSYSYSYYPFYWPFALANL